MYAKIFGVLVALAFFTQTASAQHGGHGGGGGGHGGGAHYGGGAVHYGGGYGGGYYGGGYHNGYYHNNFYGGIGFGFPLYGGLGYGLGGGYPYYGGAGYPYYGGAGYPYLNSDPGYYNAIPYSSSGYSVPDSSSYYTPAPAIVPNTQLIPDPSLNTPNTPPNSEPIPINNNSPAQTGSTTVTIVAPAGMEVSFDDKPGQKSGNGWVYTASGLQAGKTYTMKIKARWGQNGSAEVPLQVTAGGNVSVDLSALR